MKATNSISTMQARAIAAIVAQTGATLGERAAKAGVRVGTLRNWRRQPAFEDALKTALVASLKVTLAGTTWLQLVDPRKGRRIFSASEYEGEKGEAIANDKVSCKNLFIEKTQGRIDGA